MTLNEISKRLYKSSVAGYFNGEKFTHERLLTHLKCFLRPEVGNRIIMTIALPDGEWYMMVEHYGQRPNEFDYTIPETREQECWIKDLLLQGKASR